MFFSALYCSPCSIPSVSWEFLAPSSFTQLTSAALLSEVTSLENVLQALASGLGSIDWVNMDTTGLSYVPHYLDEH